MKRLLLYPAALVAALLLVSGCTPDEVPATKPLLTEADQARLRDLESLGFEEAPTEAEYQAFANRFAQLTAPELDYFNQLVTNRSVAEIKRDLPAAEQEPAIRTLEMSLSQKKKMNAYAVQTFGKTYLHLNEEQFAKAAQHAGLLWETSVQEPQPAARVAQNPGCVTVWACNVTLAYSDSGSNTGHLFNQGVFTSVFDRLTRGTPDCDYGFQAGCSLPNNHKTITSTMPYARTMFSWPRPAGFGSGPFASQTTSNIRRLLLGRGRVDFWNFSPGGLANTLRLLYQ